MYTEGVPSQHYIILFEDTFYVKSLEYCLKSFVVCLNDTAQKLQMFIFLRQLVTLTEGIDVMDMHMMTQMCDSLVKFISSISCCGNISPSLEHSIAFVLFHRSWM